MWTHCSNALRRSLIKRGLVERWARTTSCGAQFRRPNNSWARAFSSDADRSERTKKHGYYWASAGVLFFSFAVLSVPAYRLFCESTTFVGLTQVAKDVKRIATMGKREERLIRVQFNADTDSALKWQFRPLQKEIYVHPGETALVFYSAYNPTEKPIVGISSYNLTPFQAAFYFNKIQCFCFEDQILNPGERVDLPVFFFIDPDFAKDPQLEYIETVMLSYTFFESESGLVLPDPFDPKNRPNVQNLDADKNQPAIDGAKVEPNKVLLAGQEGSSQNKVAN